MEKTISIRPGIESAITYAPFDEALESLTKNGYELISLEENAELRIQQGKDHYVSKSQNWVKEGVLYIPRKRNKLVGVSPILESAKEATQDHRAEEEFYPTEEQIEQSLIDSIDFPEKTIEIPTDEFGSRALTIHAFGGEKKAKAYGEFLDDAGIKEMPIYAVDKDYVDKQGRPFARQLWFRALGNRSMLYNFWGIYYEDRMRGIKNKIRNNDQPFLNKTRSRQFFNYKFWANNFRNNGRKD